MHSLCAAVDAHAAELDQAITLEEKIINDWDELAARVKGQRPLVFTNGVFDILHRGHVQYLHEARAQGACLVLAVNSDDSVRRLGKGADRPINALGDRQGVLAGLASVDFVTMFSADTPLQLIAKIRPEILVKGGDWPVEKIVGATEVQGWGGRVLSIPFQHQRSTSNLLQRIRERLP
ncbi:D-glycero-beta-D-manno-heptose 1-phosphate adenylyltransferase [Acidithiobacillus sp. IBUN Pt1247-S3]|uniref:D-glycero-beta-D-manno-heptose 1-phosphate adenylyltransferase n=1 Tax=Acidithiobacillus sp. IBUN Pt1247-S3 TaxID=3166642 RepID=UPI0034E4E3C8